MYFVRLAVKQVPVDAKVVVLKGPPGNFHADARRESWQKEFFDKRPDVKIVGEDIANWNKDEAMTLMERRGHFGISSRVRTRAV